MTAKRKQFRGVDDGKPRTNTDYGDVSKPAILPERKLFITLSAVGMVDEKNKLVYSRSYKRIIAQKDKPLAMLADIMHQIILPTVGCYSSREAAAADLKDFQQWAAGIEIVPPSQEKKI